MKIYNKIESSQLKYLIKLFLREIKISPKILARMLVDIINIIGKNPELLDINSLLEVSAEISGYPYQQTLICIKDQNELKVLLCVKTVKGKKKQQTFTIPIDDDLNKIIKGENEADLTLLRDSIEKWIGRISQLIFIEVSALKDIVNEINTSRAHQIFSMFAGFKKQYNLGHIQIVPLTIPKEILELNIEDLILKFGEIIQFDPYKSNSIIKIPFYLLKICVYAIRYNINFH